MKIDYGTGDIEVGASFQPLHGMRQHIQYVYNEGRPAGKTLDLLTSTKVHAYDTGGSDSAGTGDITLQQWTLTGRPPHHHGLRQRGTVFFTRTRCLGGYRC